MTDPEHTVERLCEIGRTRMAARKAVADAQRLLHRADAAYEAAFAQLLAAVEQRARTEKR